MQLPALRAALELRHGRPARVLDQLEPAIPFERAYPQIPYLRGLAFLRLRKGVEAAAEFRKLLDHKGANWGIYYPLAYLGLARGATLAGDTRVAKRAFEQFSATWKEADPRVKS